jgi:hypothetical protein
MRNAFSDRGWVLIGYMISACLLLLGVPVISTDRSIIVGCLLTFPLILFAVALLRTRRSAEDRKELWIVHIDLMLKLGVALIAVRVLAWLTGD